METLQTISLGLKQPARVVAARALSSGLVLVFFMILDPNN